MDKRNFTANITYGDTTVMDSKLGAFKTYCVLVNTFVIATFLSQKDMMGFVNYLKERGIGHLPDKIINHIRDLSYQQNLGAPAPGIIKPIN